MMRDFSHVQDKALRERLELFEHRGTFQGAIGDYSVYHRDGEVLGFLFDNKGIEPDWRGSSEAQLYQHTGRRPFPPRGFR